MKKIFVAILVICSMDAFSQVKFTQYELDSTNRTEVITNEKPHNYICHLFVKRRWGGLFPSTGSYIGDNKIITAGHSVSEHRNIFKNKIQYIEIYLFEYFENKRDYHVTACLKIPRSEISVVKAHPNFKGKGMKSRIYDYGVIKLNSDTLSQILNDSFILGKFTDFGNSTDLIHITGYPGDKQLVKEGSLWDKSDEKKNITTSTNYLTYGIYTFKGDSGAPIWVRVNNEYYVVGIHNTGYKNCNGGVMITDEVIEFLNGI